jgi:prevent-host-death family protein
MENESSLHDVRMPFTHFDAAEAYAAPASAREVPVKEAKAKLTELLRAAEGGERIVLTRHGKPVADLVPHQAVVEEKPMSVMERVAAWHKANPTPDIGWVSDDFDDQLPEDFLLQPFPDDFDEKLAAANARVIAAHRKMAEERETDGRVE